MYDRYRLITFETNLELTHLSKSDFFGINSFFHLNFPVATKESLAELHEMKERLNACANSDEIFDFDMDVDKSADQQPINKSHVQISRSENITENITGEKPPSKLVSYIMEKGFAQTWFFKDDQNDENFVAQKPPIEKNRQTDNKTVIMDENASFFDVPTSTKKITAKDFSGMFEKKISEDEKKKKASREENFIAPQNF